MKAKFLDIIKYDIDGWDNTIETHILNKNSDLEKIINSIKQMNRFTYPIINIRFTEYDDSDYMNIMGGNGAFSTEVQSSEHERYIRYIDLDKGKEYIQLWESDQGAAIPEYNVCYNIKKVIAIAEDYSLSGRLSEKCSWLLD